MKPYRSTTSPLPALPSVVSQICQPKSISNCTFLASIRHSSKHRYIFRRGCNGRLSLDCPDSDSTVCHSVWWRTPIRIGGLADLASIQSNFTETFCTGNTVVQIKCCDKYLAPDIVIFPVRPQTCKPRSLPLLSVVLASTQRCILAHKFWRCCEHSSGGHRWLHSILPRARFVCRKCFCRPHRFQDRTVFDFGRNEGRRHS